MENIVGNKPVSGSNFYGRDKFVRILTGLLESRNSFLLLGLRRMGKSSSITEALRRFTEVNTNAVVISINCQTYKGVADFYKHIYLALPKDWQSKLREALNESKKLPTKIIDVITDHVEAVELPMIGSIKLRNDLIQYSNPLREEITNFLKRQEKQIVIFIDELPSLFEYIERTKGEDEKIIEVESILTTLRMWREIGISQAICGSLNLHIQLEKMGISKKLLAGLNSQQLPKYKYEEAYGLIEALSNTFEIKLRKEQIELILTKLPDHIPQFLQKYFSYIKTFHKDDDFDIATIYDEYLYPDIVKDFEYQFEDRLAKFNKEDREVAIHILNKIKKSENGKVSETDILRSIKKENSYSVLLKLMNHEFLIKSTEEEYHFSLELLKNWWSKKKI